MDLCGSRSGGKKQAEIEFVQSVLTEQLPDASTVLIAEGGVVIRMPRAKSPAFVELTFERGDTQTPGVNYNSLGDKCIEKIKQGKGGE